MIYTGFKSYCFFQVSTVYLAGACRRSLEETLQLQCHRCNPWIRTNHIRFIFGWCWIHRICWSNSTASSHHERETRFWNTFVAVGQTQTLADRQRDIVTNPIELLCAAWRQWWGSCKCSDGINSSTARAATGANSKSAVVTASFPNNFTVDVSLHCTTENRCHRSSALPAEICSWHSFPDQ